jgi:uncharacterized RDD family membrane protein YckC
VIRICSHCGALLLERTENCSFCDAPLVAQDPILETARISAPARSVRESSSASASVSVSAADTSSDAGRYTSVALEPAWREEVTRRLDAYRLRHGRPGRDDSQSGLPFAPSPSPAAEWDEPAPADDSDDDAGFVGGVQIFHHSSERTLTRNSTRTATKPQRKLKNECMEIRIQPEFDFTSRPDDRAHPQNAIVPVANLADRRIAGALDGTFLAFTFVGFLLLFRSLVGPVALEKVGAIVYLAAFFLFYVQYFFLFTVFAGSTPGMQLRELTIVRLDGSLPDTRQLLWRSFGYVLSGATFMLGFLWSLWDEDRFTWQDRISQTYITAAMPTVDSDAFEVPVSRHTHQHHFAHK